MILQGFLGNVVRISSTHQSSVQAEAAPSFQVFDGDGAGVHRLAATWRFLNSHPTLTPLAPFHHSRLDVRTRGTQRGDRIGDERSDGGHSVGAAGGGPEA